MRSHHREHASSGGRRNVCQGCRSAKRRHREAAVEEPILSAEVRICRNDAEPYPPSKLEAPPALHRRFDGRYARKNRDDPTPVCRKRALDLPNIVGPGIATDRIMVQKMVFYLSAPRAQAASDKTFKRSTHAVSTTDCSTATRAPSHVSCSEVTRYSLE
jgi:hypothetical protein